MKWQSRTAFSVYASAIVIALVFISAECKTTSSRVPQASSSKQVSADTSSSSNVFYSVARSLASEALSQFKESARRNPRLGFNITMLLPPSLANLTGGNSTTPTTPPFGSLLDSTAQLGLIGLKGGILGLKAAAAQAVVLVLFIVFLLTGIAYFACNIGVISCSNVGGSLSNLGGGLGGDSLGQLTNGYNPLSRGGYDYHNLQRSTSAVYNAIDEGQKKFT